MNESYKESIECIETSVPLPKRAKRVECKWMFKMKEGIMRVEPSRFKLRLVAKIH